MEHEQKQPDQQPMEGLKRRPSVKYFLLVCGVGMIGGLVANVILNTTFESGSFAYEFEILHLVDPLAISVGLFTPLYTGFYLRFLKTTGNISKKQIILAFLSTFLISSALLTFVIAGSTAFLFIIVFILLFGAMSATGGYFIFVDSDRLL